MKLTYLNTFLTKQIKHIGAIQKSVGVCCIAFMTSCGSSPEQDVVVPIPEPMDIPMPADDNSEIEPDPVDENPDSVQRKGIVVPPPTQIPTAKPVPGRPGYVFNPYTQNMVDVDGIPSQTKVKDPQDSVERTFYVP